MEQLPVLSPQSLLPPPPSTLSVLRSAPLGTVVCAATAARMSTPSSLPSSPSPRPSPRLLSPRLARSHALCLSLLLVLLLTPHSTTASPYYEREWTGGDDDAPVFETDGTTSGASPRASDSPSIAIPRPSATTRTEATTDRQIRPETLAQMPTVPSPQIVSVLQTTLSTPTVITTVLSIEESSSTPLPEPASSLEQQNTRMLEIVANLTKKIETPQGSGAGSDVSITFTPDELRKLQEIIGSTADGRLKVEPTRRQLMLPSGTVKNTDLYNYDDTKQHRPENPRFHEKEMETTTSAPPPETNSTVFEEATFPPTEPIPDDLVLTETEISDQEIGGQVQEPIDGDLVETFRPALCKLNTEDEVLSIIWMFLQSHIREWGYDEEQSTVLVLTTFGLLLDSEHTIIETEAEDTGLLEDLKAAVQCLFRDCQLAMPNKRMPVRNISMPSSPKLKRETTEYHSDLFECRCPSGYVFA